MRRLQETCQQPRTPAEAVINTGDTTYAKSILTPMEISSPEDWQARILLARIHAEAHDDAARDAEPQKIISLHANTTDPGFRPMTQVLTERDPTPNGHMDLYNSLQPWSRYNIYEMARVYDKAGSQMLRITLESADFDPGLVQAIAPGFGRKRRAHVSMDGYADQPATAQIQATQTHMTYGFSMAGRLATWCATAC